MISSAVVIPEQDLEELPSPTLKRRQSSASSDSNKRPRLDLQTGTDDGAFASRGGAMSPPARKRSALGVGAAEERKRGQRLFGALLGTLSQTSSKPAHKKRDEIEQRQRERLRKDNEEKEEERRRKRDELDKVRRVEQKAWDKESMRIRHRNMRAMAGFLQTKTEPKLYFKPWELREGEEEQIRQQIREVEDKIRDELDGMGESEHVPKDTTDDASRRESGEHDKKSDRDRDDTSANRDDSTMEQFEDNKSDTDDMKIDKSEDHNGHIIERKSTEEDKSKDDDHAGEELVEGQEDDVIY